MIRRHRSRISIKWSIIWIFIHSISLLIMAIILDYLKIQNEFFQLLTLGFGITIFARIARILTTKKRFIVDKWFLFWSLLNAFTIWLGYIVIDLLDLASQFWNIILIAVFLVLIANIIRRFRLNRTRLVIVSLIIIGVLFFFTYGESDLHNYFGKIVPSTVQNNEKVETDSQNYEDDLSDIKENIKIVVSEIKEDIDPNSEKNIQKSLKKSKEESMEVFNYLNDLRTEKNIPRMEWDERAYDMAISRSKDMYERGYFSHKTPEGECMYTLKSQFGFGANEIVAENLGGMEYYGDYEPAPSATIYEPLQVWIGSPGHNENLFYSKHTKGAIGCYKAICAFNGVHTDPYGLGAAPCSMYD